MNGKKLFLQTFYLMLTILLLIGCSGAPVGPIPSPTPSGNPIVGKWKSASLTFTFSQYGKLTMENNKGAKATGEYKITDKSHLWTNISDTGTLFKPTGKKDNMMEYEFNISGDKLTLSWKQSGATASIELTRTNE
jgi:hypothetical protein